MQVLSIGRLADENLTLVAHRLITTDACDAFIYLYTPNTDP